MINYNFSAILSFLSDIDPSPFFVLSLFPYIVFLYYAQRSKAIPRLSLWGFRLTILFVFMTIIFALISLIYFDKDLTNVDPLHGAAESFLTLSDALIVLGFFNVLRENT